MQEEKFSKIKSTRSMFVIKLMLSFTSIIWFILLLKTNGSTDLYARNREIYLITMVLANIALFKKVEKEATDYCYQLRWPDYLTATLITVFIASANIYPVSRGLLFYAYIFLILSGFPVICLCLIEVKDLWDITVSWFLKPIKNHKLTISLTKLSWIVFFLSLAINLIIFFCFYPGILTPDSFSSLEQILSGSYSNHHPFWYTMWVKLLFYPVYSTTRNLSTGIAAYSIVQILIQSAVFTYVIRVIYRLTESIKLTYLFSAFYILYPVSIMYASTMWKDIPHSLSVLVFSVVLAEIIIKKRSSPKYLIILFISGLIVGTFRSNGLIALILTILGVLIWKSTRKLIFPLIAALITSIIATGPVLHIFGVEPNEYIEKFSIPVQQISRVIHDNRDLTEDQTKLIESFISIDTVKNSYSDYISDPIKFQLNSTEHSCRLAANQKKLLKLYIDLGIQYPDEYINAWIDQTKGYWNGGYHYWIWSSGLDENSAVGQIRQNGLSNIGKIIIQLEDVFRWPFLNLFFSIGLWVWIFLYLMINLLSKKQPLLICFLPVLGIWCSLLVATPVFCEYRYIYSLFICMPLFLAVKFTNTRSYLK